MTSPNYSIREYPLQQGALEIAYIEEYFNEFPTRKTATEIMQRLEGREFQILMAEAPLPDDPATVVPVSYKVSHELRAGRERSEARRISCERLRGTVEFDGQRVLYNWLGATRLDWRGQGHFRALTEEQEVWAVTAGLRRRRRQDEEPLLRHARHARQPAVQRRSSSSRRPIRSTPRSISASARARSCSTRTAAGAK